MNFTTRPELTGTFGMVSSTHWIASQVGMGILEKGGNAFDAVVGTGFALQVVEPHQNGPGGDLVSIFSRSDDKNPTVLCAQGPAPRRASIDTFEALGLDMVPGSGLLAAAVPGATLGWLKLSRDHGRLSLADVIAPAISYAKHGYPVAPKIVQFISQVESLFRDHWTTSADLYLPHGELPTAGQLITNKALARTFSRLVECETETVRAGGSRESGIEAVIEEWSRGFVSDAVVRFSKSSWRDSSGNDHSGLLEFEDMADWRPTYEFPESVDFAGHTIYKPGFWSQGPVFLQQLSLLKHLNVDPGTGDGIHKIVESTKLAFADREAWYGDSSTVPGKALFSPEYIADRAALIGDQASNEIRPGSPNGIAPRMPDLDVKTAFEAAGLTGVGEPNAVAALLDTSPTPDGEARSDTVHVDVVDRWGNMISAMPSGGWLHSSPTIPELGFPLGPRLQMAWLDRGLPNSLQPGKRPRTTLSPTLVYKGSEPVLAFGSPGGDQQDQWQLHFLLNHLLRGLNLQESIDAPAFHSTHTPSSFYPHEHQPGVIVAESRFDPGVIEVLKKRGHRVGLSNDWEIGRLCAVARNLEDGTLRAAANPRGMQGYAVGR